MSKATSGFGLPWYRELDRELAPEKFFSLFSCCNLLHKMSKLMFSFSVNQKRLSGRVAPSFLRLLTEF